MIVYDLKCHKGHQFEAWFRDSAAFDEQQAAGDVRCPSCGSKKVEKALMAPNLGRAKGRATAPQENPSAQETRQALRELRRQVEANCDYVGERFPEEARKIHYGEADARGIYGESTAEEAKSLDDEGVKVQRIPWLPNENS
ncbi:MAG: DUF1178 family protein [Pseudomonadota bacterium]